MIFAKISQYITVFWLRKVCPSPSCYAIHLSQSERLCKDCICDAVNQGYFAGGNGHPPYDTVALVIFFWGGYSGGYGIRPYRSRRWYNY